ncbi:MAG: FGGY family carbohydrate kinase, partial [Acidimicrobiales bacterium]
MPLVLGVESGAAATAVEVRDADDGHLVATARVDHPQPSDVSSPQDPGAWWDAMADAVAAAGVRDVGALSVAGQRQALVLTNATGSPLCPASPRADARAEAFASDLVSRLGAERLARATGHVPGSDTPLARLAWLVQADPSLAERVGAVFSAHDHLTSRLTGRRVTDRSGASATGWWGPTDGRWRLDLLDRAVRPAPAAGWSAVLPSVLAPGEPADWMSATVHELLRLRGRPLVAAGLTDIAARALAAGVNGGAALALLLDDATASGLTPAPAADPSGVVQGFADAAGGFLPTVPLAPVGPVLDAACRLLSTDMAGLAELASRAGDDRVPDGAARPVLVPFSA